MWTPPILTIPFVGVKWMGPKQTSMELSGPEHHMASGGVVYFRRDASTGPQADSVRGALNTTQFRTKEKRGYPPCVSGFLGQGPRAALRSPFAMLISWFSRAKIPRAPCYQQSIFTISRPGSYIARLLIWLYCHWL